jgi:hypothetical protein
MLNSPTPAHHQPYQSMHCCRSDAQRLQDENTQLREEIQYLQQLLAVWQPPACTCQLTSSSSSKAGRSGGSTAVQDASSTQAAIDKIIRRQQVLIAQQQRQLQVLQVRLGWQQINLSFCQCTSEQRRANSCAEQLLWCDTPPCSSHNCVRLSHHAWGCRRQWGAAPEQRPSSRSVL